MFMQLGRSNWQGIYLLAFWGILFMPLRVQAVLPMEVYAERIASSPIKAIAEVIEVKVTSKSEYDTSKEVLFKVERSFEDKSLQVFTGKCNSLNSGQRPELGGDIYYYPRKGDKVFVTVEEYDYITSYTRLSPRLEEELYKNGLKNILFGMGNIEIKNKNNQNIYPLSEKNDDFRKKMFTEGRDQWKKGELKKALLTLGKVVKSDPSNKQAAKVLKSMQLQKKKIDVLLRRASGFIDKNDYQDAKKSLKKASYISESYPEYKKVLQQLVEAKQKAEEKNESTDFGVF